MSTRSNRLLRAALKQQKGVKPHKYRAKRTVVDGIAFASKAEAKRFQELKMLEKAGEITALELQPAYPLIVNGVIVARYRADFRYWTIVGWVSVGHKCEQIAKLGTCVVEDTKGYDTPVSKLKRKMVEAQYGIQIQVIR